MIDIGTRDFLEKRILLLQGPMGPFFFRLAKYLKSTAAQVYKINFNGGDLVFYPNFYSKGVINFRKTFKDWPVFFENVLKELDIDAIMLFGDCRPIHSIAREIAHKKGVEIFVFEEGYIRPDYITLENFGANNYSLIPRAPSFYSNVKLTEVASPNKVDNAFWYGVFWAIIYYFSSFLLWPWFRHYRHHRPLNLLEGRLWILSFWRRIKYAVTECKIQKKLICDLSNSYFLALLQVHNDIQVSHHSSYKTIEQFIQEIISSFASYAPSYTFLIIKHHPMDRGYRDYSDLILNLARKYKVSNRIYYIHDQHLPTLIKHTRGVVLINSTVGLSALYHGIPLKVCGRAIYDMPGLTFRGTLDDFWRNAQDAIPDRKLFKHFYNYLIINTQLNGSFYKNIDKST